MTYKPVRVRKGVDEDIHRALGSVQEYLVRGRVGAATPRTVAALTGGGGAVKEIQFLRSQLGTPRTALFVPPASSLVALLGGWLKPSPTLVLDGEFHAGSEKDGILLASDGTKLYEVLRGGPSWDTFVNARKYGVVPDGTDVTVPIQRAFDEVPVGSTLYFPPGTYTLSGSITCDRRVNVWAYGATWSYDEAVVLTAPAFQYGKPTSGQFENCSVAGLKIVRGYSPTTGAIQTSSLKYTAFDWYALFSCTIQDCITQGFEKGHLIRGGYINPTSFGNSLNNYINLTARHPTRYAIWIENGVVGGGSGSYCNSNYFLGGRAHIATADTGTTWIEDSENTAAVWIEYPDALSGSIPNGHVFVGTDIEGSGGNGGGWGRKLYCHGEDLTMLGARWERPKGNQLWVGDHSTTYTLPAVVVTLDGTLNTVNAVGHGFIDTDPVYLTYSVGGGLPTELKRSRTYWVRDATANTFKLAATNGGAAIDFTGNGSGTITCTRTVDIEIDHTGNLGGANVALKGGVDLYAQDIALINGATRVAREATAQTDFQGIPFTFARGGTTGPLAAWNTSGGSNPAFTVYDSNGVGGKQRLHLQASVLYGDGATAGLGGLAVKNTGGTEVNRLGARTGSPNSFFMQKGLIVNDAAGTGNDFQVKGGGDDNVLYVDASALTNVGAVGVGTATPAYKLDTTGDIRATADVRADTKLHIGAPGADATVKRVHGEYLHGSSRATFEVLKLLLDEDYTGSGGTAVMKLMELAVDATGASLTGHPSGVTLYGLDLTMNEDAGTSNYNDRYGYRVAMNHTGNPTPAAIRAGFSAKDCTFECFSGTTKVFEVEPVQGWTAIKDRLLLNDTATPTLNGTAFTNYDPGAVVRVEATVTATTQVQGLGGGFDGQVLIWTNLATIASGFTIDFMHNHASGTQKILTATGGTVSVGGQKSIMLIFNGTNWRHINLL